MSNAVHVYLSFMFWFAVLSVVVNSLKLVSDHPRRPSPVNVGSDVFSLIAAIVLLGWVALLLFG